MLSADTLAIKRESNRHTPQTEGRLLAIASIFLLVNFIALARAEK